jgi:glutamate/tyrosine decarboxylase-like PLP-dependent enzyme
MKDIDRIVRRGFEVADLAETELRKVPDREIITPNDMAVVTFASPR